MPIDDELIARAPILLGVSKPNAKFDDLETNMTIQLDPDQRRTVKHVRYINDLTGDTTVELDSHTDTCVLGRDALIFLDFDRPVVVKGYESSLGTKTYATVSGALAYDDPLTGKVYHIVITKPCISNILTTTSFAQCNIEVNDVTINEMPNFLARDPTDHTHVLPVKDPLH